MKQRFFVSLYFCLFQFIFSILIWGYFEFALTKGDMYRSVPFTIANFARYVSFGTYAWLAIANGLLFALLSSRNITPPGLRQEFMYGISTAILSIPLFAVMNRYLKGWEPLCPSIALLIIWSTAMAISILKDSRRNIAQQ